MPLAFPALFKSSLDWDLLGEPEPGLGQPAPVPAARPHARRLQLDQRDDLHPRQPRRLRRLGGAGLRGLGLRRRAAVLQALGGQRARRGRLPRRRRSDAVSESRSMHPLVDTMLEAARAGRARAQPRLQRRPPGGRRPLPADPARRPAVQHSRRVPAPGCRPPEPRRDHARDGAADPVRGRAGGRGRDRARRLGARRSARSAR